MHFLCILVIQLSDLYLRRRKLEFYLEFRFFFKLKFHKNYTLKRKMISYVLRMNKKWSKMEIMELTIWNVNSYRLFGYEPNFYVFRLYFEYYYWKRCKLLEVSILGYRICDPSSEDIFVSKYCGEIQNLPNVFAKLVTKKHQ